MASSQGGSQLFLKANWAINILTLRIHVGLGGLLAADFAHSLTTTKHPLLHYEPVGPRRREAFSCVHLEVTLNPALVYKFWKIG